MDCAYRHIIVNYNSMLLAYWSWLELLSGGLVVRLWLVRRVLYVIHALIEYLRGKDLETVKSRRIEEEVKSSTYLTFVWPSWQLLGTFIITFFRQCEQVSRLFKPCYGS